MSCSGGVAVSAGGAGTIGVEFGREPRGDRCSYTLLVITAVLGSVPVGMK